MISVCSWVQFHPPLMVLLSLIHAQGEVGLGVVRSRQSCMCWQVHSRTMIIMAFCLIVITRLCLMHCHCHSCYSSLTVTCL